MSDTEEGQLDRIERKVNKVLNKLDELEDMINKLSCAIGKHEWISYPRPSAAKYCKRCDEQWD